MLFVIVSFGMAMLEQPGSTIFKYHDRFVWLRQVLRKMLGIRVPCLFITALEAADSDIISFKFVMYVFGGSRIGFYGQCTGIYGQSCG